MSATPRPWSIDDSGSINVLTIVHPYMGGMDEVAQLITDEDEPTPRMRADADLIVRAVNAFPALLAVAKATAHEQVGARSLPSDIVMALAELDRLHPGWREWTR